MVFQYFFKANLAIRIQLIINGNRRKIMGIGYSKDKPHFRGLSNIQKAKQ